MGKIVCTDYTYESEKVGEAFDNYKIALICTAGNLVMAADYWLT